MFEIQLNKYTFISSDKNDDEACSAFSLPGSTWFEIKIEAVKAQWALISIFEDTYIYFLRSNIQSKLSSDSFIQQKWSIKHSYSAGTDSNVYQYIFKHMNTYIFILLNIPGIPYH